MAKRSILNTSGSHELSRLMAREWLEKTGVAKAAAVPSPDPEIEELFKRVRRALRRPPGQARVPAALVRKLAGTDTVDQPPTPQPARTRATPSRAATPKRKLAKRTTRKRASR